MKSLWLDTVKLPEFPQLRKDIKTDVLIIGGGIAGILTAYYLHQKGVKYILVEKDTICSHTTGNTTAKITFQHGLIYHKILKSWGFNTAKMYLEANKLALKSYNELCENINCDHQVKDNYVYTLDNRKKLEDEYYALDKIGYNAQLCEYTSLPFKTLGAIKFTNQAQFNPLKFISQISKSLNIYEQTFVKEMAGNTAITNNSKINADKIIVATHFPFINKHGSYFLKLYQHRSYVIALENANKLNGMYVDENKRGLSFRNQGDFLLIGGGSHRTGKNGGNWNELRAFADIYYPNLNEKYHWSTQDCMSLDSIPYIGHYSKNTTNLYTACGFNKWGMTGAMVSAIILSDMVTGVKNDFAEIFNPSRNIIKPQLFINGFEATKNLLTITNKRCPHLGCGLKWNPAEHSWDCPCHGSRFSEKGKIIDNPANGDLHQH
ncbi:MAG: FAD-dependent oxidoreductase [Acutalibacteraceae bacterium]|nr:FAD-dependent oxidoreductase [Acutalibacteraceae bacterium]